jgi:chromosome partitioning protein
MKTVAIVSGKGGVGKTTLALNLAIAAELRGCTTVVIDMDPQASAGVFADIRENPRPAIINIPAPRLSLTLQAAEREGAAYAFVDSPPRSGGDALTAAGAADLVLIPTRLSLFDLKAIEISGNAAKLAGKPAVVVFNAVPPRAIRQIEDATKAVALHGLAASPIVISQRAAFSRSVLAGLSVLEYEPEGQAAAEIWRLFEWLVVSLSPKRQSVKSPNPQHRG